MPYVPQKRKDCHWGILTRPVSSFLFVKPPLISPLDLHKYLENPIGLLFPTAHNTLETNHNGAPTFFQGIDKTLAIVGNQGQIIMSNASLALCVVIVVVLVAIATQ